MERPGSSSSSSSSSSCSSSSDSSSGDSADSWFMKPAEILPLTDECKHYQGKHEVPWDIQKYFAQRYSIFSLYEAGIYLTDDAWFGVTPEPVARKIAQGYAGVVKSRRVLIDAFGGAGGNTIAFALTHRWDRIISIERDAATLACAQHNAQVYGVDPKTVTWVHGDSFELLDAMIKRPETLHPDLRIDYKETVVFASPPWGGPGYRTAKIFNLMTMQPYNLKQLHDAYRLMDHALFLPRTSDLRQIVPLVPEGKQIHVMHYCMYGASKALVVYMPAKPPKFLGKTSASKELVTSSTLKERSVTEQCLDITQPPSFQDRLAATESPNAKGTANFEESPAKTQLPASKKRLAPTDPTASNERPLAKQRRVSKEPPASKEPSVLNETSIGMKSLTSNELSPPRLLERAASKDYSASDASPVSNGLPDLKELLASQRSLVAKESPSSKKSSTSKGVPESKRRQVSTEHPDSEKRPARAVSVIVLDTSSDDSSSDGSPLEVSSAKPKPTNDSSSEESSSGESSYEESSSEEDSS